MAYDEKLADRLREVFAEHKSVDEKKMFGGIAYMYQDHMCVGIVDDMLMVRIGPEQYEKALSEKYVKPMDFTGRPMKGYIYVGPQGLRAKNSLKKWVSKGIQFVKTLPAKTKKKK